MRVWKWRQLIGWPRWRLYLAWFFLVLSMPFLIVGGVIMEVARYLLAWDELTAKEKT